MWLPPLWQQLTGQPANLTALLGNQTDEGARVGLGKAVGAMTHLFALPPDWTNPTAVMATAPVIPWLLILPVAALALAVRRRDAVALRRRAARLRGHRRLRRARGAAKVAHRATHARRVDVDL